MVLVITPGWVGGALAELLRRRRAAFAEKYVTPIASGLIAGESLTGVMIAMLIAAKILQQ